MEAEVDRCARADSVLIDTPGPFKMSTRTTFANSRGVYVGSRTPFLRKLYDVISKPRKKN